MTKLTVSELQELVGAVIIRQEEYDRLLVDNRNEYLINRFMDLEDLSCKLITMIEEARIFALTKE